jgi:nickel-type superoxide dismutase maturation protease
VTRRLALAAGILGALTALLLAWRRALDVVEVEGGSMLPTMQPGDRLLVEALSYRARSPRIGELVLSPDPRLASRELIKRVASVDAASSTAVLAGDAPDASTDSRVFGPVPLRAIRWRVVGRYWPIGRRGLPATEPEADGAAADQPVVVSTTISTR